MRNILYPLIGAAVGSVVVWVNSPQFDAFMAARWYEVHSVTAEMEPGAEWPVVKMERSIHKPFTGTWTTTLWRQEGSGFVRYCSHDGRNDYLPDTLLPKRTNLNWWMNIPPQAPCPKLRPGRYKMTFAWIVVDDGQPLHGVRAQTNVFNVPG
jgi:hypothetical protein